MKPPSTVRTVVWPVDWRVGLSRSITPDGNVPPEMSNCIISVVNTRVVAPGSLEAVTFTLTLAGALACWNEFPPSVETSSCTSELNTCV